MARVVVLIADLLFGSRIQEGLRASGHEVALVADGKGVERDLQHCDVLVVDLADERLGGMELVEAMSVEGGSASREAAARRPQTLGFYSHVDVDTRDRALRAGFDLVVPRSRMAREGGKLVGRLASS